MEIDSELYLKDKEGEKDVEHMTGLNLWKVLQS